MPTATFYTDSTTICGYTYARSTSSWAAAAGSATGTFASQTTGSVATMGLGNRKQSTSTYDAVQSFIEFDTSSLPTTITINSITLTGKKGSGVAIDNSFVLNVYKLDYGTSITTGDFSQSYGAYSGLSVLASATINAGNTEEVVTFTSTDAFKTNVINTSGDTRLSLVATNSFTTGPTGYDFAAFYIYDRGSVDATRHWVLTIDYTEVVNQSVSGGISPTGTVNKRAGKVLSGVTGTLSGTILTGIQYLQALSGSISSLSGSFIKRTNKALSGSTESTGSLIKKTTKSFAGSPASLTGALNSVRTYLKAISGTMGTLSGALTNRQNGFGKILSGSITSLSGAIPAKVSNIHLSGNFSAAGRLSLLNSFKSAIIKAGTVVRRIIKGGRDIGYYS